MREDAEDQTVEMGCILLCRIKISRFSHKLLRALVLPETCASGDALAWEEKIWEMEDLVLEKSNQKRY